jgi:hypothetical protein
MEASFGNILPFSPVFAPAAIASKSLKLVKTKAVPGSVVLLSA